MSYGLWGRTKERDTRAFFEKTYRRQGLADWDEKWHRLSVPARDVFLNVVKGPAKKQTGPSTSSSVAVDKFPPPILKELVTAGFVEVQPARSKAFSNRVIACPGVYDFATRVRALHRMHLLNPDKPSEIQKYVDYVFLGIPLKETLSRVLHKVGIDDSLRVDELVDRYVIHHRWPGWVAKDLNEPLAERILKVVREADVPLSLTELPGRINGVKPEAVRSVLDQLVTHLALVEDLDLQTRDLVVGFLPTVRADLIRASQTHARPPLLVCERPREVGPDGSVIVNDLRNVLLEIASDPPRLRQDQSLFHKEGERFQTILEPLPAWWLQNVKWSDALRISQVVAWARSLQLVKVVFEGKQLRLHLNSKGRSWLSADVAKQYDEVYNLLRSSAGHSDMYFMCQNVFVPEVSGFSLIESGDSRFLGQHVTVLRAEKGKRSPNYWEAKREDYQALRSALDEALSGLKPGLFYRLDSVISHLAVHEQSPLNRGLAPDQVAVFWHNRLVPALDEAREEVGRNLIDAFMRRRLIPLGCVRTAIDDEGRLCVAREPWYDAYFGRPVALAGLGSSANAAARVVVQPDFSVIVIGLNPAPAADLAPFCERASRGTGQGALIFKITRDSVVKAVSQGLKPSEIVDRIQRHASNEVPANVLQEVKEWSNWVRQVTISTMTVLRCPSKDTADRVMGALKRQAERVNPTLVAIDQKRLTSVERSKLRSYGIIVEGESEAQAGKSKRKRKSSYD